MREITRYRISGSLFLLALAVIFVPMLFDGAGPAIPSVPVRPPVTQSTPVAPYDEVVPVTSVVEEVTELKAELDADGFATGDSRERLGEPILRDASAATSVWAVQAGSFSQVENARNLRQQLRDMGLEAFISSAKTNGTVMHRVAIGPLLSVTDGETIIQRVNESFSLEAQLVEMEP